MTATPKTAALAGVGAAIAGIMLGPYVDHSQGLVAAVFLVVATASVAIPMYFFVFGLRREQLVGFWMLRPDVLKRVGAWFLSAASVAALFQFAYLLT